MRILVFGDSIAEGKYDTSGGWVARLVGSENRKSLENLRHKDKNFVCNLGVGGNTVKDIIDRLPKEIEARVRPDSDLLVILAVGTNDAALIDNRVVTDEQDFVHDYNKLIDTVNDYTPNVVLVGLPAVDESIAEEFAEYFSGKVYVNNRINLFEDCIKQIAFERQTTFIPLHDSFLKRQESEGDLLSADGLHPSDKGHEFIFTMVSRVVDELLNG